MIDTLDKVVEQLLSMPIGILVIIVCVLIGYVLRKIKRFPNDGIPLVVILNGIVLFMMLAPAPSTGIPIREWLARNFICGLVYGFVAWMGHNQILSRIEEKIPFLKNFLDKETKETPTNNEKTNP